MHPPKADAARRRAELAQVFARHGAAFQAANRLAPVQQRALRAITACRTEALGGHVERCDTCEQLRYHYHSCRNRNCPKCQTRAKERWLAARRAGAVLPPGVHAAA
jgi:Transposase zinc-binding domain